MKTDSKTGASFCGFVLAGGKSSRMNRNKAFLEMNGETFLARAVKTLSTVCEKPIRVVIKREQYYMTDRFPVDAAPLYDVYDFDSPLDGVRTAFHHPRMRGGAKYAVILAIDLPYVTAGTIEKLAEIAVSSDEFAAVVPRQTDERPQPLCAVYDAERCLPQLKRLINENQNASARDFLDRIRVRYVDQNELERDESRDLFFNVNRPQDFQKL